MVRKFAIIALLALTAASNASALRSKSAAERKEYEQSLLGRAQARVNRRKSRR